MFGNTRVNVTLTNVAVVRLKRGGQRFEVAAYKNKATDFRAGLEPDLDQVLQVPSVFTNVSRGVHASAADLLAAFGTDDQLCCARLILEKGELEKGELERAAQFGTLFREVAATVADKCVNPSTGRAYPVAFVEKALHDVHFAVLPGKSAKQQALKAVAALRAIIPIERAKIQLRVTAPSAAGAEALRAWLAAQDADATVGAGAPAGGGGASGSVALNVVADPALYRALEDGASSRARPLQRRLALPEARSISPPPPPARAPLTPPFLMLTRRMRLTHSQASRAARMRAAAALWRSCRLAAPRARARARAPRASWVGRGSGKRAAAAAGVAAAVAAARLPRAAGSPRAAAAAATRRPPLRRPRRPRGARAWPRGAWCCRGGASPAAHAAWRWTRPRRTASTTAATGTAST